LAEDKSGSAVLTVTLVDNGPSDGANENTSTSVQITVNVDPVNDAPVLSIPDGDESDEDAGEVTRTGFVTVVSKGSPEADEQDDVITYAVTAAIDSGNLAFDQLTIDANGNLTYKAADNTFGTATVTVTATDDGGTPGDPSDDVTVQDTFTITV